MEMSRANNLTFAVVFISRNVRGGYLRLRKECGWATDCTASA